MDQKHASEPLAERVGLTPTQPREFSSASRLITFKYEADLIEHAARSEVTQSWNARVEPCQDAFGGTSSSAMGKLVD